MSFQDKALGICLGIVLALCVAPYAHAQAKRGRQSSEPGKAPTRTYSDNTLRAFLVASAEVREIRQTTQAKLNQAPDPQTAQQIRREANEKMVSAVEDTGLKVREYNEIANQTSQNPQLVQRLQRLSIPEE